MSLYCKSKRLSLRHRSGHLESMCIVTVSKHQFGSKRQQKLGFTPQRIRQACSNWPRVVQQCIKKLHFDAHIEQGCATTVYGTVYSYTVRYGNTAYSRIYTVLDRIYGKVRYGVRYGPNFESLNQKIKIELCFSSANG